MRRLVVYHGWRKMAYSWPAIVLLGVLLILLTRSTWQVYNKWSLSKAYRDRIVSKNLEIQERKSRLENDLLRLQSEHGWEEEVRRTFQVAKPGEGVLILVGTTTN